ncbi:MAG: glutamate mutase L [Candidatus Saccharicenans sp.]
MKKIISLDLGSTWTKGGLFTLGPSGLKLEKRISVPTTQDNLVRGFRQALAGLLQKDKDTTLREMVGSAEIYFSSSAKGGLRIAAIGLVPDLTLQLAKLAAMSAGGKVIASYSFSLTRSDIGYLENLQPDILLFSGGTDGGNSRYVLENARKLAASSLSCPVIYAGNRAAAEEVVDLMQAKEVIVTENLMPEVGQVNLEPAREKIRDLFLKRIISGRGLSEIVNLFGTLPQPTPLAVFELISAIPQYQTDWSDLAAIDIGGATTDFYSNTESYLETDTVVLKGIREPKVKRTVEGDLGLRVSAQSLADSGWPYLEERLLELGLEAERLRKYLDKIALDLDYLPQSEEETLFDRLLAETCVYYAALRHSGGWRETYTPQGRVYVQTGKDLRRVKAIVGSGGFLAASGSAETMRRPLQKLRTYGQERKLLPEKPLFYADRQYLFSLLGNLVGKYPKEATALAVASLENLKDED